MIHNLNMGSKQNNRAIHKQANYKHCRGEKKARGTKIFEPTNKDLLFLSWQTQVISPVIMIPVPAWFSPLIGNVTQIPEGKVGLGNQNIWTSK